jgi:hypothetical protein
MPTARSKKERKSSLIPPAELSLASLSKSLSSVSLVSVRVSSGSILHFDEFSEDNEAVSADFCRGPDDCEGFPCGLLVVATGSCVSDPGKARHWVTAGFFLVNISHVHIKLNGLPRIQAQMGLGILPKVGKSRGPQRS